MEQLNYKELKAYRRKVTTYTANKELWANNKQALSNHKWYKALMGMWSETYFKHEIALVHPELLQMWKFNVPYRVNTYKRKHVTIDLDALFFTNKVVDIKTYTDIRFFNTSYKPDYYCIINVKYDDPYAIEYFRGRPMIMNTNSWDYYLNPENVIFDFLGLQSKQDVWSNKKFLPENYETNLKKWMSDRFNEDGIQ